MREEAAWLLTPSGQRRDGSFVDDTLLERARERGLLTRLHAAGEFPRQRVEVMRGSDLETCVNERYYRRGWTDGLPVVAPTLGRVDTLLEGCAEGRNVSLGEVEPLGGLATVEKIAANAVMAGCGAEHLPVVLAAVRALIDPHFNLRGVQTTDENVTPVLIVSGPATAQLEINAGLGALGPGWRGSAAIGRAVRLVMHNIGGGWPAAVSLAGLGQPARYTLCFAEDVAGSPWPSLSVEHGFDPTDTVLTVLRAEAVVNVTGGLAEIASVMGSATSAFSMAYGGHAAVVLSPFVARRLAAEGHDKNDVKRWLHTNGRVPRRHFEQFWLKRDTIEASRWPAWLTAVPDGADLPVLEHPDDLSIVVAGGDLPIAQHAWLPTWGFPACRIHQKIDLPV